MISVIICAAGKERLEKVTQNIAATIGVEYELLAVLNNENPRGICEVYNDGARAAKYPILCFVHDDVSFLSQHWGQTLLAHFTHDPALALAGLAGDAYKSAVPSGWWSGAGPFEACHIGQRKPDGSTGMVTVGKGPVHPVRTLDGVFLCMRKSTWKQFPFNQDELKGFHFYDIDLSLRVSAAHKVAVLFDIDLVHFSYGSFGDAWMRENLRFHRSVNRIAVPCTTGFTPEPAMERKAARNWMLRMRREKLSAGMKLRWCTAAGVWWRPAEWPYMVAFLFSISLKKRT
ncbi:glycosyltransferase family protein [Chitinophaga horti]|uniref:Glycosyltransferase family protein n=1 Tax=Chitinophaga horti TaxID=2920382 RepID=A0ABY6JBW1_9BACT|nr:glycosyltransferase family protein [Chitinophaga horti]UYQ95897.1 glycosyltransferase family protein [Chitinophaga horti]